MNDKLTICFNPWLIFHKNDDYDSVISEIAERGFNCIRFDDGAGLLWDENGNARTDVLISSPFGKFTEYTTYRTMVDKARLNLLDRFLKVCRSAKKHNVKVILSSWFFLHTNWFCEEKDITPLFDMPVPQKISFFADELGRILDVLKKEKLIEVVAFAEIFNEFDGLPFAGEYGPLEPEKANQLRILHEKEIDKLKNKHPDILFAYDSFTPEIDPNILPRNIDVLNFHIYYLWSIYHEFEKGIITCSLEEPEIPEQTRYFLRDKLVTVKEIVDGMGELKTGLDWARRISLYSSIDPEKLDELSAFLDAKLKERVEHYRSKFCAQMEKLLEVHTTYVPNSKLVVGEGLTYCASPALTFERDSETFWQLAKEQMQYFKEKGVWGSVISTTHAPDRSVAWERKDCYIEANKIFTDEK